MSSKDNSTNMSAKKKRFYNGMLGYVEEKGSNYLYIATRASHAVDRFTLGFHTKNRYEQIGVYVGNTDGIKEGATVEVYFKKYRSLRSLIKELGWIKGIREFSKGANIERVVLVKQGTIENQWQSFKEFFFKI